ncbi:MAG: hypothetical protein AAF399_10950 [Bacteroidota bacterium]
MLRLLSIEYFKLRNTRFFWALIILFALILIAIPFGIRGFVLYLDSIGDKGPLNAFGLRPIDIPLFDFVDLWQNLTWVYNFFSLFLGFIAIISIGNEYTYGTIKQNIIDGLSRQELFWSKVYFMGALSLGISLLVLLIGLIAGFLWSPVTEWQFVVHHIEFIPAYAFHLLAFQLFCLTVSLWIKRTGIVMALITFYVYGVEKIFQGLIRWELEMPALAQFLPARATEMLIPNPFPKYVLQETITTVPWQGFLITAGAALLYGFLSYRMLTKRDLN